MNTSQLLEIVQEVYNSPYSAKDRQGMKLSLSGYGCLRETDKRVNRENKKRERKCLIKKQCACCKQKGHCKNGCPSRKEKEQSYPSSAI